MLLHFACAAVTRRSDGEEKSRAKHLNERYTREEPLNQKKNKLKRFIGKCQLLLQYYKTSSQSPSVTRTGSSLGSSNPSPPRLAFSDRTASFLPNLTARLLHIASNERRSNHP